MKRALADGWFQAFAAITALSGAMIAFQLLRPRPEPLASIGVLSAPVSAAAGIPEPPVMPPPPAAAAPAPPPAAGADSRLEAAARGSPEGLVRAPGAAAPGSQSFVRAPGGLGGGGAAQGGGAPAGSANFPIYRIAPKTRGRWIVANADGPDVDSPSIARVIFSASDGDVVLIKPGLYLEPLATAGKSLTFRGLGARPEEVLLTAPDAMAVLRVSRGSVKLENLRIEPEKGYTATAAAVYLVSGRLSLKNVVARSSGVAVKAAQSQEDATAVSVVSSRLDGAYADVLVRGTARLSFQNVDFSNPHQPIVAWRDARVAVDSCRFPRDSGARLYVYEDSRVNVALSPTAPRATTARSEKDAETDRAQFADMTAPARQGATQWVKNIFRPGPKW